MFNTVIYQPILQALLYLNDHTSNLGLAIVVLTILIRLVLVPVTLPSIKAAAVMRKLKPELDELKKKHGKDKAALQQEQLKLFQEHKVNPAAGCLPQIVQLIVLIGLYRVFIDFLGGDGIEGLNTAFLWFDVRHPDNTYILPLIAAGSQLVLSLMIMPAADPSSAQALAASTKTTKDDDKADDMAEMATTMQQQMMFIMPIMTGIIAVRFPSGLALYWVMSTIASVIQQYMVSGWGDLPQRMQKLPFFASKR